MQFLLSSSVQAPDFLMLEEGTIGGNPSGCFCFDGKSETVLLSKFMANYMNH